MSFVPTPMMHNGEDTLTCLRVPPKDVPDSYPVLDWCKVSLQWSFQSLNFVFYRFAAFGRYDKISQAFKTCNSVTSTSLNHLYGWIRNSFTDLAMMNYPYPTDLLAPLPGYPVNVSDYFIVATFYHEIFLLPLQSSVLHIS